MKVDSLDELKSAFEQWRRRKRHVRESMPRELLARAEMTDVTMRKLTFNELFELMEEKNFIEHLREGAIFKYTGGEPMVRQKQLLKFTEAFIERYDFLPRIDFETNATIMPDPRWRDEFEATFTTSPIVANSRRSPSRFTVCGSKRPAKTFWKCLLSPIRDHTCLLASLGRRMTTNILLAHFLNSWPNSAD